MCPIEWVRVRIKCKCVYNVFLLIVCSYVCVIGERERERVGGWNDVWRIEYKCQFNCSNSHSKLVVHNIPLSLSLSVYM